MDGENNVIPNEEMQTAGSATGLGNTDIAPTPEKRCPTCQALVGEEQMFCPECGTALKKVCVRCGAQIADGQSFCPACGQRVGEMPGVDANMASIDEFNRNIIAKGKKANTGKKVFGVIGVLALVAAIASYFVYQNAKKTDYIKNAEKFYSTVLTSAANLENIGNEIKDEWYDSIYNRWSKYDDINEAVQGALKNKAKEITDAENQKSRIDALYSKLKKPANDSDEMKELCEAVKVLYDEYEELYDCVTDPSGNYSAFTSKFGECDSETLDAYEDLRDLCDDFN